MYPQSYPIIHYIMPLSHVLELQRELRRAETFIAMMWQPGNNSQSIENIPRRKYVGFREALLKAT
jgi:hypothetical protein